MYIHYSGVWSEMAPNSFVIVLLGIFQDRKNDEFGVRDFLGKIEKLGYETVYFDDLEKRKIKYQYVVSNHIMGGVCREPASISDKAQIYCKNRIKILANSVLAVFYKSKKFEIQAVDQKQYIPLRAGVQQVRFMYGADISDEWSLDAWNEIYDLFLCHGPNDRKHLKKRFSGKTAIMGYPRYDGYFSPDLEFDDLRIEFSIDRNKETILWMPTLYVPGESVCSIPNFAESVAKLRGTYNIIVRPHPITLRENPEIIDILESLGYQIDKNSMRDMNKLYRLADYVFCDYGGSPFGSLYLQKKMIILSVPNNEGATFVKNSSNLELNSYYPVIGPDQVGGLIPILQDANLWNSVLRGGEELSKIYFADYRGTSSIKAAKILTKIEDYLANNMAADLE